MKIVTPKFEEINIDNPLKHGEVCARVCYKSENLIKDGSAKKLLSGIADAGHTAMLEHIPVYLIVYISYAKALDRKLIKIVSSPYSKTNWDSETGYTYVSTNLRVVYENFKELYDLYMFHDGEPFDCDEYQIRNCKFSESNKFVRRITIKFNMDRIGSQSFCRHRVFSFAQESTRWCNYLKDKFGSEISISAPCWLKPEDSEEFKKDMEVVEQLYFKWINKGYKNEEARYFLPFGLNTEIIMTGFPDAWVHFFELRNDSHAHSKPLEEYFKNKGYI
jgi:thymidylate synthase (FAD)